MRRILTILTTTLLATGIVLAQPPAAQPDHRATARQRLVQALNLNAMQKDQARLIFQQARQSAEPLRSQLKQDRQALAAAVKANEKAQIDKLSAERGQLLGKLTATRTEAMAKFYQILTPEQRAKAAQLRQEWRQHRKQG
jgi:periplasmic protein CpxP/Spy